MNLFGFELKKVKPQKLTQTIVEPNTDGSTIVSGNSAAYYSHVLDLDASLKSDNDMIRRYREAAMYPDCDSAIDDIVNDAISSENEAKSVDLILDDVELSESIKNKIREEFKKILDLLDFNLRGHDLFRSWYIDGRIFFNIVLDKEVVENGILKLQFIDPIKIRKVKDIKKKRNDKGVEIIEGIDEYFVFNDKGIVQNGTDGIKLSTDSIIYSHSGIIDRSTGAVMSHLHKAIKPVNQLSLLEHALVIYRITRAPERRIFYIDVGNLPKQKAEQYVNDIMNKYRNKIVYNATTGEVQNDKKHLSMMEDFWMPRRGDGKSTEITTLSGGQTLGQIEDVQYFQNKLYQSLNVPLGRLQQTGGFSLGKSSEISREEIKFSKFIARLRKNFSSIFNDALRVQLVAKRIINIEDWDSIKKDIRYDFVSDGHFVEMKNSEIIMNRLANLQIADQFVGKYYSADWVRKNILCQTEFDIKQEDSAIKKESPPPPDEVQGGDEQDPTLKEAHLAMINSVTKYLQS